MRARAFAPAKDGSSKDARMAIIAMTTSSSTRVKPGFELGPAKREELGEQVCNFNVLAPELMEMNLISFLGPGCVMGKLAGVSPPTQKGIRHPRLVRGSTAQRLVDSAPGGRPFRPRRFGK